ESWRGENRVAAPGRVDAAGRGLTCGWWCGLEHSLQPGQRPDLDLRAGRLGGRGPHFARRERVRDVRARRPGRDLLLLDLDQAGDGEHAGTLVQALRDLARERVHDRGDLLSAEAGRLGDASEYLPLGRGLCRGAARSLLCHWILRGVVAELT